MTPIEAALARVREVREMESRMTPGTWEWRSGVSEADSDGIAALRNAAPTMLGLLEALLVERQIRRQWWTRQTPAVEVSWTEVDAALAAFVEGKDGE